MKQAVLAMFAERLKASKKNVELKLHTNILFTSRIARAKTLETLDTVESI
jgi:hypothetical protein